MAARARPLARAGPRRVPAPLVAIMLAAVAAAVAWTCVLPPVQGPDEDSHFAYVQKIGAAHTIPWHPFGAPANQGVPYSTELAYALTYGAVTSAWANPAARPARTPADVAIWERFNAELPPGAAADGGFTPTMEYPPLYYLYAAVPYEATSGLGIFDRVFAVRLANIPALLAVVVFTWLLAGELFGRRRWLQALATLAVALQPQLTHMTAVVNPDVFLAGLWAAALYAMVVMVKRGPTRGRIAWTAVLALASCLTQPRGVAILIPAAAALGLVFWRHRRPARGWVRRALVAGAAALSAVGLALMVDYALLGQVDVLRLREFASYLWQFYLPRLGSMSPSPAHSLGVRQVFVDRLFGGFANLEANFSSGVYTALQLIAAVVLASALVGIVRRRRDVRRRADVVAVVVIAFVGYMAVLHVAAFRSLLGSPDPSSPAATCCRCCRCTAWSWRWRSPGCRGAGRRWSRVAWSAASWSCNSRRSASCSRGSMRRAAVVVAVVVIVGGLAAIAPRYLTRKRDYVAVTPQAPTIAPPATFPLLGHGTACMDLVALDRHSAQARLQPSTPGRSAMPLQLTLTGPGYHAQGQIPARYADGQTVAVAVRPPQRSLIATACVRNLGGHLVDLAGVGDRSRSRSTVTINGQPFGVGFALTFYERRPASIVSRLPLSLQRMGVLRPGMVVPATLWLLLVLFVVGVPVVAVWAFARALRADAERPT